MSAKSASHAESGDFEQSDRSAASTGKEMRTPGSPGCVGPGHFNHTVLKLILVKWFTVLCGTYYELLGTKKSY